MGAFESHLTIVMPVYNRAGIVCRTLDSIASQRLHPFSVIVVDNNSTDGTREVVARWIERHADGQMPVRLLEEPKPGACAARNKGLEEVVTPYVMFFDSDDTMMPNHLEKVQAEIACCPEADIIAWGATFHTLDGKTDTRRVISERDALFDHIFHSSLATQRYAVKASYMRKAGGWDETLMGWNDWEVGVRLLLDCPVVSRMDDCAGVHVYCQEESITGVRFSDSPMKWESSLDRVQALLAARQESRALRWIEVRRCVLSGLYAREGAHEDSIRLLDEVLSRTSRHSTRLFYKYVRRYVSLGGRGVSLIARLFT